MNVTLTHTLIHTKPLIYNCHLFHWLHFKVSRFSCDFAAAFFFISCSLFSALTTVAVPPVGALLPEANTLPNDSFEEPEDPDTLLALEELADENFPPLEEAEPDDLLKAEAETLLPLLSGFIPPLANADPNADRSSFLETANLDKSDFSAEKAFKGSGFDIPVLDNSFEDFKESVDFPDSCLDPNIFEVSPSLEGSVLECPALEGSPALLERFAARLANPLRGLELEAVIVSLDVLV